MELKAFVICSYISINNVRFTSSIFFDLFVQYIWSDSVQSLVLSPSDFRSVHLALRQTSQHFVFFL